MKKQALRVVVLLLFLACLGAIFYFMPKDFSKIMGGGFEPEELQEIRVHLNAMGEDGENVTLTLRQGEQAFADLLAKVQAPTYSRTMGDKIQQILLDYEVSMGFYGGDTPGWTYRFWGQEKMEAGPAQKVKTYQISGGQETQQAILDYLLTLEPDEP